MRKLAIILLMSILAFVAGYCLTSCAGFDTSVSAGYGKAVVKVTIKPVKNSK